MGRLSSSAEQGIGVAANQAFSLTVGQSSWAVQFVDAADALIFSTLTTPQVLSKELPWKGIEPYLKFHVWLLSSC